MSCLLAISAAVNSGPPTLIVILLLTGAGVVLWSREHTPPDTVTVREDVPIRLLQWAVGLLPSDREDWGQAMLGELDRIEGRSERRRFALGCVASIVVLPPWGPVGPMAALAAFALGSAVVLGVGFTHFGLAANPWNWLVMAILVTVMIGSVVVVSVLLRRPGIAGPGLIGGLFVAVAWLGFSEFRFAGIVSPINSSSDWSNPALYIAVPLVVGVGVAWRSKSTIEGQRAARLAGASAGLAMFFLATIAVLGIDGGPRDPGVGVAGGVSEAFAGVAMQYLISVPLAMATIGWVAATATARFRYVGVVHRNHDSMGTPKVPGLVAEVSQRRTIGLLVLRAAGAVAAVLAVTLILLAR